MSLIKIENIPHLVEFNDFEFLRFEDGWNGGQWSNWDVVNNPENYMFIVSKGDKFYKIEVKSVDEFPLTSTTALPAPVTFTVPLVT